MVDYSLRIPQCSIQLLFYQSFFKMLVFKVLIATALLLTPSLAAPIPTVSEFTEGVFARCIYPDIR